MVSTNAVWSTILQIGSISGLLSLLFNVIQGVKKTPCFKYEFQGCGGKPIGDVNGQPSLMKTFEGVISNRSLETNSLNKIYVVVWGNRSRTSCRTFGAATKVTDRATGTLVNFPHTFGPRDGLAIAIEHAIVGWEESEHKELLTATVEEKVGNTIIPKPAYQYGLAFEDINGNLFDQEGHLRNRQEIDLRWTLPNSSRGLEHGITREWVGHNLKIAKSRVVFVVKRMLICVVHGDKTQGYRRAKFGVRRGKVRIFSRCDSCPVTASLQPGAIGAAVEATKASEPSR